LVGKAIKYPFRITGYALSAPFHPFKSTRKAFNATLDLPEKVVDSTEEALFGHDHKHRDKDSDGDDKKEAKRGDADKGDDKGK